MGSKIKRKDKKQTGIYENVREKLFFTLIKVVISIILLLIVLHYIIPVVLNYPENSINNAFQDRVIGIGYSKQFGIFSVIMMLLILLSMFFIYRSVNIKKEDQNNIEHIIKIRNRCFNYPLFILLNLSFLPALIVGLLLYIFRTEMILIIKLSLITLSFCSILAVIITILTRDFFETIIKKTAHLVENQAAGVKMKLSVKIVTQIFPVVLASFVILAIVITNMISNKIGDILYESYNTELNVFFDSHKEYTENEIKNKFDKMKLFSEEHSKIILKETINENKEVEIEAILNNTTLFAEEYIKEFYDEMPEETKGQIFVEYGKSSQISLIKLKGSEDTNYYIGVKYEAVDQRMLLLLLVVIIVLILINIGYFFYMATNIKDTISQVTDGMKEILKIKDREVANVLPVTANDETGELIHAFNMVQKHNNVQVKQIFSSQAVLLEQERLVTLGQMIGGIAHNLKTPILSIAGAAEGIKLLAEEMEESLVTPTVTIDDKKEIIKEQEEWVEKIKVHLEYMNDIITVVKGQATTFTTDREEKFTINDLFKNVEILTAHEFKNSLTQIQITNNVSDKVYLKGDFNSLLQIVNNIVVNAIQSYDKASPENRVELIANIGNLSDNIVISVRDYGKGMSKDVQSKLFKQMVTTKGKYGTGLGLYMSYSTIKGKFQGDIKFESEEGIGTTFHIMIPDYEKSDKIEHENTIHVSDIRPISGK